jgi:hypothetical protein
LSSVRGAFALWAALSCVTCSLMISGETAPLHCSVEGQRGPPACDDGFVCRNGECRADAAGGAGMSAELGGASNPGSAGVGGAAGQPAGGGGGGDN